MPMLPRRVSFLCVALVAGLVACGDNSGAGSQVVLDGDTSTQGDGSGALADTGTPDSGAADTGAPDTSVPDGSGDAGIPDTCPPEGCGPDLCPDDCRDGNPCTVDACTEAGCTHVALEICCDPDSCQIQGACIDNQAANPDNPCEVCNVTADPERWSPDGSATCDDGDLCTTGDRCADAECVGSATTCDDGNPCTADLCSPTDGSCTTAPADGVACDDGDLCTTGDLCAAGACASGTPRACDDGNPCSTDLCDPAVGCTAVPTADGTACDDGATCTVGDVCTGGLCTGISDSCDDANLCTADFCSAEGGCGHRSLDHLCADSNPCTDEGCDPGTGCVYPFNTNACDDGNLCTVVDSCSGGACLGLPLDPDDANPCTDDACQPAIGPTHAPNTLACDDNNLCTVGDTCAEGGCQPGTTPLACTDDNACTDNSCDPLLGCQTTFNTNPCDDGTVCTLGDTCGEGTCGGTPISCDDGRDCTIDTCDAVLGCKHEVVDSLDCRPIITVTSPLRAETILGDSTPATVRVTGRVHSGAGPLTAFTLNGVSVPVAAVPGSQWDYTFRTDYNALIGSNTLAFSATDDLGTSKDRVQSFHWSTDYRAPVAASPGTGMVDPGLGVWLGQTTIDDGVSPPPTDLAAIFEGVLAGFDTASLFDPNTVLTSQQGYDIYLRSVNIGGSRAQLQATDTGLQIVASLLNLTGRLYFDCTGGFFSVCGLAGGDGGGSLRVNSITVTANLIISANPDHTLSVTVGSSAAAISGLSLSADNGWTNFLLSIILPFVQDQLVSSFESTINDQLSSVVGPLLSQALGALAFNLDFNLPRLDGATDPATGQPLTIPVSLASDFSSTDFDDADPGPQGGALNLRARATTPTRGVPTGSPFDDNLGTPMRIACGTGTQELVIPRVAPMEIVFADDTLNEILHAAWYGGLMEFPVDPSLLGNVDLASYGVENLQLEVSALLPPMASDCGGDGQLRLHIGDLQVNASLDLFGQHLDLVVYVALDAPIALAASGGELGITIAAIENVRMEINVLQPELVGFESTIGDLLAAQLIPALGGLLGGGAPLASFPLPAIDLSTQLGQPPGTTQIAIQVIDNPAWAPRIGGNTIVYGQLQ